MNLQIRFIYLLLCDTDCNTHQSHFAFHIPLRLILLIEKINFLICPSILSSLLLLLLFEKAFSSKRI